MGREAHQHFLRSLRIPVGRPEELIEFRQFIEPIGEVERGLPGCSFGKRSVVLKRHGDPLGDLVRDCLHTLWHRCWPFIPRSVRSPRSELGHEKTPAIAGVFPSSGADVSRTRDLIIANDALYQLSYRPVDLSVTRWPAVIGGIIPGRNVVDRLCETELGAGSAGPRGRPAPVGADRLGKDADAEPGNGGNAGMGEPAAGRYRI